MIFEVVSFTLQKQYKTKVSRIKSSKLDFSNNAKETLNIDQVIQKATDP